MYIQGTYTEAEDLFVCLFVFRSDYFISSVTNSLEIGSRTYHELEAFFVVVAFFRLFDLLS